MRHSSLLKNVNGWDIHWNSVIRDRWLSIARSRITLLWRIILLFSFFNSNEKSKPNHFFRFNTGYIFFKNISYLLNRWTKLQN
jgi:hypothetical protein